MVKFTTPPSLWTILLVLCAIPIGLSSLLLDRDLSLNLSKVTKRFIENKDVVEAGYFASCGEESHIRLIRKSVPGSTPGVHCPKVLLRLLLLTKKSYDECRRTELLRLVESRKAKRFESVNPPFRHCFT